ncbi:adenine phosphoribosyltransferase [Candidatus Calescamantes bacterium]|nr:adenine phosphoribosyltransferase [Candidatus Calescamantes bacterium]
MDIEDKLLKIYFRELKDYKPFTSEEEYEYFVEYKKTGDHALREKIILHNQRLVIMVAKKYFRLRGISKLDILSEGVSGMLKAIDHFKPEKHFKFSTYAYFWIKAYIINFIDKNARIVKIPIYILDFRVKVMNYIDEFFHEHERKPTTKEIAKQFDMEEEKFLHQLNIVQNEYSMSFKIDNDSEDFINYLTLSRDSASFYEEEDRKDKSEYVSKMISSLKPKVKQAISLRFGLDGHAFRTLDEVGTIMSLSKERVRQIINKGVEIIQSNLNIEKERHMEELSSLIRDVPDFPKKGIVFKDITTLLKDPAGFKKAIDAMKDVLANVEYDKLASIESRGFIFGGALSYLLDKPFIPVRKKGKLPAETISESYSLEYGEDTLEMHKDAINKGDRFLIIDDLLATGGTVGAVKKMIEKNGASVVGALFLVELKFLEARKKLDNLEIFTIIEY